MLRVEERSRVYSAESTGALFSWLRPCRPLIRNLARQEASTNQEDSLRPLSLMFPAREYRKPPFAE
jgi:hypothetical protein